MISKNKLEKLYTKDGTSMKEIATLLGCSVNKVVYWMDKYQIKRRSISDAIYTKHNPNGDPFKVVQIDTKKKAELYGLGIGLYWGEGNKANKHSVRLGNTDPELIKTFIQFLNELFSVPKNKMKFGLQIFSDTDPQTALNFWTKKLDVKPSQFYKITVTISGALGTYRKKSPYGVVTLYYHNKKLRDILVGLLPT